MHGGPLIKMLIGLVAVICLLMPGMARGELSPDGLETIKDSVVLVTEKGIEGLQGGSMGSGLVVSYPNGRPNCIYVLTAAHVIVKEINGDPYPASELLVVLHPKWFRRDRGVTVNKIVLMNSNPTVDLALLEIDKKLLKNVPPEYVIHEQADLTPGTPVTHFGFPRIQHVPDLWNELRRLGVEVTRFQVQDYDFVARHLLDIAKPHPATDISPYRNIWFAAAPGGGEGGSGGPVFDENGDWIGVMVRGGLLTDGEFKGKVCSLIIRPKIISDFLNQQTNRSDMNESESQTQATTKATDDARMEETALTHLAPSDGSFLQTSALIDGTEQEAFYCAQNRFEHSVEFPLRRRFDIFEFAVAIDEHERDEFATYQCWGDGKLLKEISPVLPRQRPLRVAVNVTGVNFLKLVQDSMMNDDKLAVWLHPTLRKIADNSNRSLGLGLLRPFDRALTERRGLVNGSELNALYCGECDVLNGWSWCEFKLDGIYAALEVDLALDDRANADASNEYRFIGDERILARVDTVRARGGRVHVRVPLTGVRYFKICHQGYPLGADEQYLLDGRLIRN